MTKNQFRAIESLIICVLLVMASFIVVCVKPDSWIGPLFGLAAFVCMVLSVHYSDLQKYDENGHPL